LKADRGGPSPLPHQQKRGSVREPLKFSSTQLTPNGNACLGWRLQTSLRCRSIMQMGLGRGGVARGIERGTVDIFNNKVSPLTTSLQACHGIYYKHCVYVMFAKGFALFSAGGAPPPPSADNWKNSWGVYVM